jgi:hypothetical protein
MERSDKPLTINGIHLNAEGDRRMAEILGNPALGNALFRRPAVWGV